MNKTYIIILVIAVLIIVGFVGYSLLGVKKSDQASNVNQEANTQTNTVANNVQPDNANQNNPLDVIYLTFFNCINKCPSGSCPQPNCKPDYSSGRGASIGWVGDCKTGSFTDCIDPTCFDKCDDDLNNDLKKENYKGQMPSDNVYNAIMCISVSGEKGKDCITIVKEGDTYKQYLKYNCANSCWQGII